MRVSGEALNSNRPDQFRQAFEEPRVPLRVREPRSVLVRIKVCTEREWEAARLIEGQARVKLAGRRTSSDHHAKRCFLSGVLVCPSYPGHRLPGNHVASPVPPTIKVAQTHH